MERIAAYNEILSVLEKHADAIGDDYQIDIASRVKGRIKVMEMSERFSIDIPLTDTVMHIKLSNHISIGVFGEKHRKTISWSDDNRQPEDGEELLCISFPTGAYVFHSDYPSETFKAFFDELKEFGPKYSDTMNSNLYFTRENASNVYEAFPAIFEKHKALVTDELRKNKIAEMGKELGKLRGDE